MGAMVTDASMTKAERAAEYIRRRTVRYAAARSRGRHARAEWLEMLAFYGECVKCGAANPEKDHIIPLYQDDSTDAISNLQPLCSHCNDSKGRDRTDYRLTHPKGCRAQWRAPVAEQTARNRR